MSKSNSNLAFLLVGAAVTGAIVLMLGASHPMQKADAELSVDFETIDLGSNKLAIQITDLGKNKAYLYVCQDPVKTSSAGNSPVVRQPPKLMMTIDLKSVGNEFLDANIGDGLLPVAKPYSYPKHDKAPLPNPNRTN